MTLPFVVCAGITSMSACISLGYLIAAASRERGHARTLSLYTCARSLALLLVTLEPFRSGSIQWLAAVATAMIIVQACDAVVGVGTGDRLKTIGPAGTAMLNAAALAWLLAGFAGS